MDPVDDIFVNVVALPSRPFQLAVAQDTRAIDVQYVSSLQFACRIPRVIGTPYLIRRIDQGRIINPLLIQRCFPLLSAYFIMLFCVLDRRN